MTDSAATPLPFSLQPFVAGEPSAALPLHALTVDVAWLDGARLWLTYHWQLRPEAADPLRLPAAVPLPGAADGLWQHSCAELFVALPGQPGYLEFNFSPSGQWAVYAFADYRQRQTEGDCPALPLPRIGCRRAESAFVLTAELALADFPPAFRQAGQWQLGLTAVVETASGSFGYWALHHPGERPDFHHRGGMVATLDLPDFCS